MKTSILIITFLLLIFLSPETCKSQEFLAKDGYVEFVSRAPLLEFRGKSNNLTGWIDLNQNLVDFYVDLNTIDTGIERRNRDMRNTYLKTDRFPFAEFTGELTQPFDPENMEIQEVEVIGTFKIHGVEREIKVEGTLQKQGEGLKLEASWPILLGDYNIDRPGILFYELADEQIINISILLILNEPS